MHGAAEQVPSPCPPPCSQFGGKRAAVTPEDTEPHERLPTTNRRKSRAEVRAPGSAMVHSAPPSGRGRAGGLGLPAGAQPVPATRLDLRPRNRGRSRSLGGTTATGPCGELPQRPERRLGFLWLPTSPVGTRSSHNSLCFPQVPSDPAFPQFPGLPTSPLGTGRPTAPQQVDPAEVSRTCTNFPTTRQT